jgi:hypothetical protein
MKLESLQAKKFEAFRNNQVDNPIAITGGSTTKTHYKSENQTTCKTQDGLDVRMSGADNQTGRKDTFAGYYSFRMPNGDDMMNLTKGTVATANPNPVDTTVYATNTNGGISTYTRFHQAQIVGQLNSSDDYGRPQVTEEQFVDFTATLGGLLSSSE